MKNNAFTEFVKIETLQSTTNEELINTANIINEFLQQQDGFIDAELVKALDGNIWYFIYHIENFEKLKAVGEKLRNNKLFDLLTPLIVPESMNVSFYNRISNW